MSGSGRSSDLPVRNFDTLIVQVAQEGDLKISSCDIECALVGRFVAKPDPVMEYRPN